MVEPKPKTETRHIRRQLNLEEIKNVIGLSYMFSQGDGMQQVKYLSYVRSYYGNQKIGRNDASFIEPHINKVISSLIAKDMHKLISDNRIESELEENRYEVNLRKGAKTEKKGKELYVDLLSTLCGYDLGWFDKGGRPNRSKVNDGDNSLKDRFCFFTVNYIIRGQDTGDDAFNNLFMEMRKALLEEIYKEPEYGEIQVIKGVKYRLLISNHKIVKNFVELVKKYNSSHPNSTVTNEELLNIGIDMDKIKIPEKVTEV